MSAAPTEEKGDVIENAKRKKDAGGHGPNARARVSRCELGNAGKAGIGYFRTCVLHRDAYGEERHQQSEMAESRDAEPTALEAEDQRHETEARENSA